MHSTSRCQTDVENQLVDTKAALDCFVDDNKENIATNPATGRSSARKNAAAAAASGIDLLAAASADGAEADAPPSSKRRKDIVPAETKPTAAAAAAPAAAAKIPVDALSPEPVKTAHVTVRLLKGVVAGTPDTIAVVMIQYTVAEIMELTVEELTAKILSVVDDDVALVEATLAVKIGTNQLTNVTNKALGSGKATTALKTLLLANFSGKSAWKHVYTIDAQSYHGHAVPVHKTKSHTPAALAVRIR